MPQNVFLLPGPVLAMMTSQNGRVTSLMATIMSILTTTLFPTPVAIFNPIGQEIPELGPKNLKNGQKSAKMGVAGPLKNRFFAMTS